MTTFARIGRAFPVFYRLPQRIRVIISLVANIIDEIPVLSQLRLEKGSRFLDVGAHVGSYSVLGSRLVGHNGVVVAVEPDPDNFRGLVFNARLAARNIIPVRAAIWNRNESREFFRGRAGALSSLLEENWRKQERAIIVECLTLDTLYAMLMKQVSIDRIDSVKVDVEGAEEQVLQGGRQVLKMARFIIVEVHSQDKLEQLASLLRKSGFRVKATKSRHHLIGSKEKLIESNRQIP